MRGAYYAILTGGYGRIPHAELRAILEAEGLDYEILLELESAAVFRASGSVSLVPRRAGFVREVGLLIGVAEDDPHSVAAVVEEGLKAGLVRARAPLRVEVTRFKGLSRHIHSVELARSIASLLEAHGLKASPKGPEVLHVHVADGLAVVGLRLAVQDTRQFQERRPRKRPFFKPGPLDPQLTRALVNLSRLRRGNSVFLDPFCGTGGFVLEACLIGAGRCVCGDIDPVMVRGSAVNLAYYGCSNALSIHHDALHPPIEPGSVSSISTDPPYGRSTTLARRRREELYQGFVEEAADLLEPGGWLVYAGPVELSLVEMARGAGLLVVDYLEMYVHSSLTRGIVVARKGW